MLLSHRTGAKLTKLQSSTVFIDICCYRQLDNGNWKYTFLVSKSFCAIKIHLDPRAAARTYNFIPSYVQHLTVYKY